MKFVVLTLCLWCLISLPACVVVGRCMRPGRQSSPELQHAGSSGHPADAAVPARTAR
jgi:hypothetical protein